MSAALESLMRDVPPATAPAPLFGGLLAFIGVGATGAAAFVALSTLVIGFAHTGLADWVVNTLCYAVLIVPVYGLHRRYSFASDAPHRRALPRYLAVQCMALLLAALFSLLVQTLSAMPTWLASTLVIFLTSGVNFIVLRSWAFAREQWGETHPV